MVSLDTNLLLYAFSRDCPEHQAALDFVTSLSPRDDVVVSEWVLVELYNLLRNAAVVSSPLTAAEAAGVVGAYRRHPKWALVAFPAAPTRVHDALWTLASRTDFPRRRIFDARMALCLVECGVRSFATTNVKDFAGLGFARLWNPLTDGPT